ncbi:MAG TPA: M23 family metallopeptidase [Trichocoleus sp.]|jgi:murein DD-endopeptidase MepM/ murein hydrolase activator NlpD
MMQKKVKHLGKLFLLAGVSLCSLVVLETGEKMVKALDLNSLPIPSFLSSPLPSPLPQSKTLAPVAPSAQSNTLDFGVRSTTDHSQTVARNIGTANDPQQPVSQINPIQVATGNWFGASFPVENFQAYTSPFGYRNSATGGYTQEFHYGLDMAAPEGSYVRNWWAGKIVEVTDDTNCGTSVVVESGHWTHIYCHMQGHVEEDQNGRYMLDREGGLQIQVGQPIAAGARIGRVGMTGRTTGPHLHWGLKYDSNWVDPALVLRAMYSNQQQAARASAQ